MSKANYTQKLKGIIALMEHSLKGPLCLPQLFDVLPEKPSGDYITMNHHNYSYGVFVRPCPTTPQHGWIESKVCHTAEEIYKIAMDVWRADKNGQVIVAPVLEGRYSAVITDMSVSIGAGNDGATSGRTILQIPVPTEFKHSTLNAADISNKESPFLEVVDTGNNNFPTMVQLRSGPKIKGHSDVYFPAGCTPADFKDVWHVCTPDLSNSLVDWEKTVKAFVANGVKGVVLPSKSINSHYAIHCISVNLAVITGQMATRIYSAHLGKDYNQTTLYKCIDECFDENVEVLPINWGEVKESFLKWFNTPLPQKWKQYGATSGVALLHSFPYLNTTHSQLIGAGIAWTCRSMMASIFGEGRHWGGNIKDRNFVHDAVWCYSSKYVDTLKSFNREKFFSCKAWKRNTGYGGTKWQHATAYTTRLISAVLRKDSVSALKNWNRCAEALHNGGASVISKVAFDQLDGVNTHTGFFLVNDLMAAFAGAIVIPPVGTHEFMTMDEETYGWDKPYSSWGYNRKGLRNPALKSQDEDNGINVYAKYDEDEDEIEIKDEDDMILEASPLFVNYAPYSQTVTST